MTVALQTVPITGNLSMHLQASAPWRNDHVRVHWLGQAGFLLLYRDIKVIIDPYLSNYLAKKYAGKRFDHQRMVPPPLLAEEIVTIDYVLCTHKHSDHMDPETLPVLMRNNPKALLVYPASEEDHVDHMEISPGQRWPVDAGECIRLCKSLRCQVIKAAHEQLETDANGRHRFLGYLMHSEATTIYHSGDCIPYEGLIEELLPLNIDLALLPVNGRDETRRKYNIPGNFTLNEAIEICEGSNIPYLVGHHHGMFSFNTLSYEEATPVLEAYEGRVQCRLAELGTGYSLASSV